MIRFIAFAALLLVSCNSLDIRQVDECLREAYIETKLADATGLSELEKKRFLNDVGHALESPPRDLTLTTYQLEIKIEKAVASSLKQSTGSSSRNDVTLSVIYKLTQDNGGIDFGRLKLKDGYNVSSHRFTNNRSEEAIFNNMSERMANNIAKIVKNDVCRDGR